MFTPDFFKKIWKKNCSCLQSELSDFQAQGYTLTSIAGLEIRYVLLKSIRGSSYIKTPDAIKNTRSVANFRNRDDFCFKYSILSKHIIKRCFSIKLFSVYENKYNWSGLKWPVSIDDVKIFEKNNKNTSVHIFCISNEGLIEPLRLSKKERDNHFDLLLLSNGKKSHFTYIRNFNKLVAPQMSANIKKLTNKMFVCKKCMLYHFTKKSLDFHKCCKHTTNLPSHVNNTIPLNLKLTRSLVVFDYAEDSFKNCIRYKSNNENEYDWTKIKPQTSLKQIVKFEKKNKTVSFNVFGWNEANSEIMILKKIKEEKEDHYDLLLTKNNEGGYFYSYIKDINKFLFRYISKSGKAKYICKLCFSNFLSIENLTTHKKNCMVNSPSKVEVPTVGNNILKFENFHHQQRIPFVIYLDFECLLEKIDTTEPDSSSSFTMDYQSHKPYSFAYYIVGPDIEKNKLVLYTAKNKNDDVVEVFFKMIKRDIIKIDNYYKQIEFLNMTDEDNERFNNTHYCEHCACSFENKIKTRDHYHYENGEHTGRLRKVLCQSCNLNFKNTRYVPILAHNLSNYDGHLIIKGVGYDKKAINIIPSSSEKYIGFTKVVTKTISMKFIDTYRFLSYSLENLVKTLPKENLIHIEKFFPKIWQKNLLLKKGIFCYDYLSNLSKLKETKLPKFDDFFSKLYNQPISQEDYNHASTVFNTFNCKTLGDYAELYLKSDVLQLTEVFEAFRNVVLKNYGLDPVYYFSIPALSYDAMLKFTKVEIELLTDIDQYCFFEKGLRGGISQCSNRYAEGNNPYMEENYNQNLPNIYLTYLDANNLYGYAMIRKHPQKNFKWMTKKELKNIKKNILNLTANSEEGYCLEVDVEYPDHLHDKHNDLPFLAEKKKPPNAKHEKLLTTFDVKKKYICHYLVLKQALQHGLILKKIHRGIKFIQSDFLSKYIHLNTELRRQSTTHIAQNISKLFINSIYGKTCENTRKRVNLKAVTNWKQAVRLIAKPSFQDYTILNENVVLIKSTPTKVKLNKPIFLGTTILDQSKIVMYDFHYNVVLPHFGSENVQLLYMDTDSFFYRIETEDLYEEFFKLKNYLDTSSYPPHHFLFNTKNAKQLGKFKDELSGRVITKFVGLASKLYAYETTDGLEYKKAKGARTHIVAREINMNDYIRCLFDEIVMYRKMNNIVSKEHNIKTIVSNKLVLSFNDDKRFSIAGNKINTLAYGHYKINQANNSE
uniref:DNA-directed DNA polymerase n=1 Tax=Cacopsylla melanoneura TaxID=428564 RepID=A0A8D8U0I7_9HEMI